MIDIPRIGIKVQIFLGLFYRLLFLISSFACFVLKAYWTDLNDLKKLIVKCLHVKIA